MIITKPTGEARNRAAERARQVASIVQDPPPKHHARRLSFPPPPFSPRKGPIIYVGCSRRPEKLSDTSEGVTVARHTCTIPASQTSSSLYYSPSDPRPTAATAFAGKGSRYARLPSAARLRAQAGMDHALRLPSRLHLLGRTGSTGLPALPCQEPGRGPKPDGRVPPAVLRPRAAAGHGGDSHPAAKTQGVVTICCTSPRRYPLPRRSIPLALSAAHIGGGRFLTVRSAE